MKRTELRRKKPLAQRKALARRTPLRASPQRPSARLSRPLPSLRPPLRRNAIGAGKRRRKRRPEPGEARWKERKAGKCAVCRREGPIIWHHLLREQDIRAAATPEEIAAGIVWTRANALPVGAPPAWGGACSCHYDHHHHKRKIPFALVPGSARAFAADLLGAGAALAYFRRYYAIDPLGGIGETIGETSPQGGVNDA